MLTHIMDYDTSLSAPRSSLVGTLHKISMQKSYNNIERNKMLPLCDILPCIGTSTCKFHYYTHYLSRAQCIWSMYSWLAIHPKHTSSALTLDYLNFPLVFVVVVASIFLYSSSSISYLTNIILTLL